ncbi:SDR family NAD(P)-dependent oxidoreductase [Sinanaerobacter chloroacetimidivorans]|jgi:NAD(P)-dependent dehydrogenase (short-subunit alcohol dehydrogenase family)|uniref:SDR family oxidoreductase n=1 Tax=Sinanaerobacter chloroacetimidivorans TaxID=2818044 RepID=A0A8J8B2Q3_9FIRM|nr:SDR family oxidoreductase [Sinanaerobacter chloroacetimidivorans]MBR0599559.1 SDR family oxidoreductase [Sinanaerobacter chloroacetimidivorans]
MITYEELKGKAVLITGGTQGIGESVAQYFSEQKCKVAINGRRLDEKVQRVLDRTGAFPVMGNISDLNAAVKIVEDTVNEFGKIDIFVANAAGMSMKPFLEQDEAEWWDQVNINLTGHIACIKPVLQNMIQIGGGTIIIVSSFFGTLGWNNATGYGASKSGLLTLGQYLAREYQKYNIRVGIIVPGVIRTPQLNIDAKDLGISYEEVCDMYASEIAMARLGKPEEIAEMAVFMATEKGGRALSGRHIQVSGGEYRTTPYYI